MKIELAKVSKQTNQQKLNELSDKMKQVVQIINEEKRKRDNTKKMREILKTLKSSTENQDLSELHLLREGSLEDKKKGTVHVYLFENGMNKKGKKQNKTKK
jgi:hypothetical protein